MVSTRVMPTDSRWEDASRAVPQQALMYSKTVLQLSTPRKDSTRTIIARVLISSMTSRMATASTMVTTWKSLTMATGCCATAWALPMAHKRWSATLLSLRRQTSNAVLGPHSITPILWVRRQAIQVLPMLKLSIIILPSTRI